MEVLRIIFIVLEVIASLGLIVVILLQSGKEAGLGAIAGNSDSYMSKGKSASKDKMLASITKWVALAWLVCTLVLSLIP